MLTHGWGVTSPTEHNDGFLYGAGPAKIGEIVNGSYKQGKALIDSFTYKTPALKSLKNYVTGASKKGYIIALDGRHIPIRAEHAALNSLLQSSGAIICKTWLVGVYDSLIAQGLQYERDFKIVAFIHDELQIIVREDLVEQVGLTCQREAVRTGEAFDLKCPLAAEYKVGGSWAQTH